MKDDRGKADPDEPPAIADVLARALASPCATDPVEGIVDAVSIELRALAASSQDPRVSAALDLQARRLDAAMQLLRWIDNREQIPVDPSE